MTEKENIHSRLAIPDIGPAGGNFNRHDIEVWSSSADKIDTHPKVVLYLNRDGENAWIDLFTSEARALAALLLNAADTQERREKAESDPRASFKAVK